MNRDTDELLRSYAKPLTLGLGLLAVASFVVSAAKGAPDPLPGIALGSAVLLHLERALAITVGIALLLIFLLRGWRGDFPREFSTSGAKWPEARASEAIAVGLAERFEESDRYALEAVDRIRQALAAKAWSTADTEAIEEAMAGWSNQVERNAQTTAVAEAIRRLPERQKLVIALKYFERLSDAEVAQILGVSENKIRELARQATSQIREALGSDVAEQLRNSTAAETSRTA